MKVNNRVLSFLIVLFAYIFASALGICVFVNLNLGLWLKLLVADVVATVVIFIFSLIFKNASVYDPYWSVQPMVILGAFALFENLNLIKILLLISVMLWGVRLTANWAYTFKGLNFQDWRYTMLKEKSGKFYPLVNLFGIHIFPTMVVYLCVLPAVYFLNADVSVNVWSFVGVAISFLAMLLQLVSDCQMHKFRKYKTDETFIRTGLWKYSRHPNYLAEILMWWGVGLCCVFALSSNWWLLLGAFVNTLMFVFVSVPLADGHQSKKVGFSEYKSQTNRLLPIKLKKTKKV